MNSASVFAGTEGCVTSTVGSCETSVIGLHSHKDRPTLSYVLQGEVTYHEEGKPPRVVKTGEGLAEGKETTHWAENRAGVAAIWIAVDIPKEP